MAITSVAYVFGTKHDTNKRQVRWQLGGVTNIAPNQHELWSTNGFKLDVSFHRSYVNSALSFIARLHRRRSANGT